ncbi:hypothetical protein TrVE_jg11879 [Triparma verrucosa]|uniref:non-specific serine/threonine protein kinase n=1 Tax=Triparma verrucosa TaxID=1606542 RepID=A0A9W7DKZ4_9STRA|nr:hypothetical protein TrVE_jg11879 [Triparma verrucosa]
MWRSLTRSTSTDGVNELEPPTVPANNLKSSSPIPPPSSKSSSSPSSKLSTQEDGSATPPSSGPSNLSAPPPAVNTERPSLSSSPPSPSAHPQVPSPPKDVPPPNSSSASPPPPSSWTPSLPSRRKKKKEAIKLQSTSTKATYQLGEKIGKGGGGVVSVALNLDSGEVVAIKTLKLTNAQATAPIQTEVELLKKLIHPNIVNYIDSIRSDDSLHIVLEYMENGSLRSLCDKFDGFSESLVAIYITQVLHGLTYLHEQGVLHRDIKGANILTTKDGSVKLADFGVAMNLTDAGNSAEGDTNDNDVVGSPYWMAPEVIEMQCPTASCDIWSLGCTIIELLTGKPPYMELEPMAALFRIVQDDHPPMPAGVSDSLKDFLLLCFKKDPNMRTSAAELLSHQWLQNPQSHIKRTEYLLRESEAGNTEGAGWDSVVETLRLYARGSIERHPGDDDQLGLSLEDSISIVPPPISEDPPSNSSGAFKVLRSLSRGMLMMGSSPSPTQDRKQPPPPPPLLSSSPNDPSTPPTSQPEVPPDLAPPDSSEPVPTTSPSTPLPTDKNANLDSQDQPPPISFSPTLLADNKNKHSPPRQPTVLQRMASSPSTLPSPITKQSPPNPTDSPLLLPKTSILETEPIHDPAPSGLPPHPDVDSEMQKKENQIKQTKLSDEILTLIASLQPGCDESTIVRTCRQLLKIFNEHPELPHHFVMHHGVIPIMELLEVSKLRSESIMDRIEVPGVRSLKALPAVLQVVNKIIEDNLIVQEHLSLVGMIPVMVKIADGIYSSISARYVNRTGNLHLEAAKFVDQVCKTSQLTLQMFIAGGGLPLLVKHFTLSSDLRRSPDIEKIVGIGIDGVLHVFSLQSIRRDDFCHLFVKLGLLPHLVVGFRNFLGNLLEGGKETPIAVIDNSWEWLRKLGVILTIFAQSDPLVKERMAIENVCLGILNPFISLSLTNQLTTKVSFKRFSNLIVVLLKCVRALSVEPKTLKKLDREQAIVTLMPLLEQKQPAYDNKIFDEAIECMYYLCRIDRNRQELAARNGLIQHLKGCITQNKIHLHQFSFPLICDLAYTSAQTREELWRCDGVVFYLSILQHNKWRISALNALTVWLANDIDRVEPVLTLPNNSEILIKCFVECLTVKEAKDGEGGKDEIRSFDQICEALLRLSIKSPRLSVILGRDKIFVNHLVSRLESDHVMSTLARMCLLKMLGQIMNTETYTEHGIFPILRRLASDESQILISAISKNLMKRVASQFSPIKRQR